MKLSEIVTEHRIIPESAAADKAQLLHEMVALLCDSGDLEQDQAKAVERAVMRREELGTTGIGNGVALPHAKHAGVKGLAGALGRSHKGIDFEALDGSPVHIVFLILGSPDAVEPHLEALKKVTALLRDQDFCTFLKRAKDQDELAEILDEAEDRLAAL